MTDQDRVLNHLQEHGSITPLEALGFGCYRLSHQIWKLRCAGHSIRTELQTGKDMHGEPSTWALYVLEDERK